MEVDTAVTDVSVVEDLGRGVRHADGTARKSGRIACEKASGRAGGALSREPAV
ncbi:MAG: hypothetical protein LBT40_18835 [Deltaproteobacteria bacterium]|nr:hypothetical protein [Deltaproteobacteria bacterium]